MISPFHPKAKPFIYNDLILPKQRCRVNVAFRAH